MRNPLGAMLLTAAVAGSTLAGDVLARIKLITLPARERVEIQLDHPDVTLVEEERVVPLLAGNNQVDFSWAGTPLERDSIVFRVVPESGGDAHVINVLSVSYPPGENALVWTVASDRAGPARVRISYVMQRLQREFSYRAVASADERELELSRYLRVTNLSGEAFGDSHLWLGDSQTLERPIELNEAREMLVERIARVPVRKTYNVDAIDIGYLDRAQDKLRVAMRYAIDSSAAALGGRALPAGKVRIFQDDGRGGSAFLGEDRGVYTAPGETLELDVGVARDVAVKRIVESREVERVDGMLQHREVVLRYEMENFKNQPVTLRVLEKLVDPQRASSGDTGRDVQWQLGPRTDFPAAPVASDTDARQLLLETELPAADADGAGKVVQRLHLVFRNEW